MSRRHLSGRAWRRAAIAVVDIPVLVLLEWLLRYIPEEPRE